MAKKKLSALVFEIRNELRLTQVEFRGLIGLIGMKERNYKRLEAGDWDDNPGSFSNEFFIKLAKVGKRSAIELLDEVGVKDKLEVVPEDPNNKRVHPLTRWPSSDMYIRRAVDLAEEGRRLWADGSRKEARHKFEEALNDYLAKTDARLLKAYIKIYLGNTYEMLGFPDAAEDTLKEAKEISEEIDLISSTAKEKDTIRAAKVMILRATVDLLWVEWARGNYDKVIQEIIVEDKNVLELRAMALQDWLVVPRIYRLLARAYHGKRDKDSAILNAYHAVNSAVGFSGPMWIETSFFLDYPKQFGYIWHIDNQRTALVDILIANNELERAYMVYSQIHEKRRASAHYDFHNWQQRNWQSYLHEREKLDSSDILLKYNFDDWDQELKHSGDIHIRAWNIRAYALAEQEADRLDNAVQYFTQAQKFAKDAKANHLYIQSTIELSLAYVKQRNKTDAVGSLDKVTSQQVDAFGDLYLKDQYLSAWQAIAHLDDK